MAPGGSACNDVLESYSTVSDYEIATAELETSSKLTRATSVSGGKQGIYSTNGVHELLECPVCTCLMYPPIHQVVFNSNMFRSLTSLSLSWIGLIFFSGAV